MMRKANPVKNTILWGALSIILYLALFFNQQFVTDYFTRGGYFSILVISTALLFSFVHGAFANYFIEAIGFKPINKK